MIDHPENVHLPHHLPRTLPPLPLLHHQCPPCRSSPWLGKTLRHLHRPLPLLLSQQIPLLPLQQHPQNRCQSSLSLQHQDAQPWLPPEPHLPPSRRLQITPMVQRWRGAVRLRRRVRGSRYRNWRRGWQRQRRRRRRRRSSEGIRRRRLRPIHHQTLRCKRYQ